MNMHRAGFIFLVGLAISGCDCGDDVKIVIISPEEGAVFNLADDVDEGREGVQVVVQASTEGLDLSSNVNVVVDDGTAETAAVGAGGVVTTQVTLDEDGSHTIKVSAEGASDSVTVTLDSSITECPDISVTSPRDGDTLTAADDTDEEPCGEFHYTVEVATNAQAGRTATLYVNDNSVATATVEGPAVTFADVTLDGGDNVLEVVLDGTTDCSATASVRVDCGVTCTIASPTGDVLNASVDDDTGEPGMQKNFTVETDSEDGQSTRLVVDDEEPGLSASATGGSAEFPLVSLAEGERTVQAVCRDAAGNEARSARVRFTVDTVLPEVEVTDPDPGQTLNIQNDDQDEATDGLQIQVCATSDEDNELCAAVSGADPGPDGCANVDNGQACVLVTCNGDDVIIEASTEDDAGNVGVGQVTVDCDAGAPVIIIDQPAAGEVLNAADDENGGTAGLQATVVACTDEFPGTADLEANGVRVASADVVEQDCQPEGLGAPLRGTVTFAGVTLPEGSVTLVASIADGGGNSTDSPPVTVTVDSALPTITFSDPQCGITVVDTDEDAGTAGLQYDIETQLGAFASVVDGTISWEAGGSEALPVPVVVGPFATFDNVTFRNGTNTITINLVDTAGNADQVTCAVQGNEGGTIRITSPAGNTAFPYSSDSDHGTPGYQGAVVTVTSDGPVNGAMDVCVQDSGGVLIPVPVCVQYAGANTPIPLTLPEGAAIDGGYDLVASTQRFPGAPPELQSSLVRVRVDTILPTTPASVTATVIDVRAGTVRLQFTAPEDPSGRMVTGYQVRRSSAPFANEGQGTIVAIDPPVIQNPGASQTVQTSGLAPQTGYYFAVRATDRIGNVGLSGATAVATDLLLTVDTINSPTVQADHFFGFAVAGGSDVDNDGFDDVVVGSVDFASFIQRAYVFAGGNDGLGATPLATIAPAVASGFGAGVALLDNFNGDDAFADVAVSDFVTEAVWVFDGGAGLVGDLDTGDASVTITGVAGEFTGVALSYFGDVNGDGYSDLGIVASGGAGGLGVVYVIYGGANLPAALTLPVDADLEIRGVLAGTALSAASPAGDVNGDGVDDLLVGACATDLVGSAYVIYGGIALGGVVDADSGDEIASQSPADQGYGCSVGGVGDVDGNGFGDVIIGSRDFGADDRGAFFVALSDGLGGFTTSRIDNGLGPNPDNDLLGYAIASTTGVGGEPEPSFDNSQNRPDIAVGQYRYNDGAGRVNLIWGDVAFPAGDVTSASDGSVYLPAGSSQMDSLVYAGDVDGDGWVDLVAGDYAGSVGGVRAGRIYVVR